MINLFVFFALLDQTACYEQDDDWNKLWSNHAHYDRGHLSILGTKDTSGLLVWQNSQGFVLIAYIKHPYRGTPKKSQCNIGFVVKLLAV